MTHPDTHHTPATDPPAVAGWLAARGLSLPAWIVLECVRPFGWMLAQLCLLAEPLGRGIGVEGALAQMVNMLESPERLAALSEALAPREESA